ncbi:uncharacterized protein GGS22DRAFT_110652 [Annulohypoxylon maeteangense]|uniref:uncharacterized protein n=1 Tax=Annulohypoxylon maeteangense TaxID=1927788 RepID=UPI0020077896|nr:uncharacterized protein GGS22DRAFT_110652 [Annulohypoxylon maeteangense]KAI0887523.1 hypothetical protein GGS22DRAFT_110652 [Annulohypoxylon maeteangense]
MASSSETLRKIADQAERDLNTYGAKTGTQKSSSYDNAGVDTRAEKKFPGAEVRYGTDVSTNAGYNRRIPPEEGGDVDARGRQTRGEHFEGIGGPQEKVARQARDFGGNNEFDPAGSNRREVGSSVSDPTVGYNRSEAMNQGKEAARANVEGAKGKPRKQFKGSNYFTPESVPGSISAEGYEPPESITHGSREAEGYEGR